MSGPFNTETTITLTKTELLALLAKLNRTNSAKSLIRKGEDDKEYFIQAITDEDGEGHTQMHHLDRAFVRKYLAFEESNK